MTELYRYQFELEELARNHRPQFTDPNKRAFYEKVSGGGPATGTVEVTRWQGRDLPTRRSAHRPRLAVRTGFFTYDDPDTPEVKHWHLNFANYDLFSVYEGSLLAQDEMQVLEHPDLARVRLALIAKNQSTLVTDREGPTPILIGGVPRRGIINTAPTTTRPEGLYGNRFTRAAKSEIDDATTRLDPATISHIVAIEAPNYGHGPYSAAQIDTILITAMSGFGAAVTETPEGARTAVHTGWWGCGAYGGNQELMALLQLLAAEWAGVDELVFHTGTDGEANLNKAIDVVAVLAADAETRHLVEAITDLRYMWGVSNNT